MGSLLILLSAASTALASLHIADYDKSFIGDPDVFIIGVQKGGTTSLSSFLMYRLKNFVESYRRKELHFFDKYFNDESFNDYIKGFVEEKDHRGTHSYHYLSLDSSPAYFRTPIVWQRIVKLYSPESLRQKKFILSLRDPISRDFSWFSHYYGECKKYDTPFCPSKGGPHFHDTFHDYVERNFRKGTHPGDGFYVQNLKSFLEFIPRSQLFIINFESLIDESRQQDTLHRMLHFLGIPPVNADDVSFPHANSKEKHCEGGCDDENLHEIRCSDLMFLNETYSRANHGLVDFINSDPDRPESEPLFQPFEERIQLECK